MANSYVEHTNSGTGTNGLGQKDLHGAYKLHQY